MIGAAIVYLRPESLEEAFSAWSEWASRGGGTEGLRWLGGGTEILTGARFSARPPRVLIDLKALPETRALESSAAGIYFGAALSLSEVRDSGLFPLLSELIRHIADHTTRNRLSLGGNLAGGLPYREVALPLLLAGASIRTALPRSEPPGYLIREEALVPRFERRLLLEPGELVLGFAVPAAALGLPYRRYRATRSGPVDYPLASACFLRGAGGIGAAFSGLHPHPVVYASTEEARAAFADPAALRSDQRASAAYRAALALDMIGCAEEELA